MTCYFETLEYMATALPLPIRLLSANLWAFGWLLKAIAKPKTMPMLRTTTAVTIVNAGAKVNVVPQTATAWVNHRLLPGDTAASVLAYDRRTICEPPERVRQQTMVILVVMGMVF